MAAALLLVAASACSGGSDETEETVVVDGESVTMDELEELIGGLGGEVVEDTSIQVEDGSAVMSVGGLTIDWPRLAGLLWVAQDASIYIPPAWPTLAEQTGVTADPPLNLGVAVVSQTELVVVDESRQELVDWAFRIRSSDPAEIVGDEVVHVSRAESPEGRVCHTELRQYSTALTGPEQQAVVMVSGPGIASSGFVFTALIGDDGGFEVASATGEFVELVCGERPEGL